MKSVFTPKYVMDNRGCYSEEQAEKLSFIKQNEITIADIMNSEIPMKDKRWWFINACEMTTKNRIDLALILARVVLPIYENKYPNDKRVRECLDAIDDFNAGKITRDDLLAKRRDAAYAAVAADADADADAAAAAYAVAYGAYAADAADAAAYAADADAADAAYKKAFITAVIKFFEDNKINLN